MCGYPTLSFQTRYPKHSYFFYLALLKAKTVHYLWALITQEDKRKEFPIMIITLKLMSYIACQFW